MLTLSKKKNLEKRCQFNPIYVEGKLNKSWKITDDTNEINCGFEMYWTTQKRVGTRELFAMLIDFYCSKRFTNHDTCTFILGCLSRFLKSCVIAATSIYIPSKNELQRSWIRFNLFNQRICRPVSLPVSLFKLSAVDVHKNKVDVQWFNIIPCFIFSITVTAVNETNSVHVDDSFHELSSRWRWKKRVHTCVASLSFPINSLINDFDL